MAIPKCGIGHRHPVGAVALKLPVVREKLSDAGTGADTLPFGPDSLGLPQHTLRAFEKLGKSCCGLF